MSIHLSILPRSPDAPPKTVVIHCQGHANLRATHTKTLELTTDLDISQRGTCIIGVDARFAPAPLLELRGPVQVELTAGECHDALTAIISPTFKGGDALILRRHHEIQDNTFAFAASKSAADLDRRLIAALNEPESRLTVTIRELDPGATPVSGVLYLVGLPIGNPLDLTLRAQKTLLSVDLILAEDTRTAGRFLKSIGIDKPIASCHDHNEAARAEELDQWLRQGARVALISEAGLPTLADPGFRVVGAALAAGAAVTVIPGPSAITAALALSGLPSDRFSFMGFIPRNRSDRHLLFQKAAASGVTTIFFESPHRLDKSLADLAEILPQQPLVLTRNLTKHDEAALRGTASEILVRLEERQRISGEFTLVMGSGAEEKTSADEGVDPLLRVLLEQGISARDLSQAMVKAFGLRKKEAFDRLLRLKEGDHGGDPPAD